ncbi:hypothetical protein HELRODRAFT_176076 [Helobdella robusta]|uniref:Uncharacterized protein n=1 Tax=Helobdella robusta TaxID=6412 RepID=T1FA43_HELRO|nr:hypothetical protein HELRODRAFT_176076 [Helobdella robusta]ESO00232.1 hypothetical protein HELRODRAFT_176076 [Helobdella robusta]
MINCTPEIIRPFKIADREIQAKKIEKKARLKRLNSVFTPVKTELEARQRARELKTRKKILIDHNQLKSRKTAKLLQKQKKSNTNFPTITTDDKIPCHLCGILVNVHPFEDWREFPSCEK